MPVFNSCANVNIEMLCVGSMISCTKRRNRNCYCARPSKSIAFYCFSTWQMLNVVKLFLFLFVCFPYRMQCHLIMHKRRKYKAKLTDRFDSIRSRKLFFFYFHVWRECLARLINTIRSILGWMDFACACLVGLLKHCSNGLSCESGLSICSWLHSPDCISAFSTLWEDSRSILEKRRIFSRHFFVKKSFLLANSSLSFRMRQDFLRLLLAHWHFK